MAGSWLKMRHDLADDPAVIRLGADRGLDEDAVIGKLFRLWSWADRHTVDGQADGVQLAWVDRLTGCQGFGAALVRVGWLVESDAGLSFPRFDRHCSDTAKARAQGETRTKRWRDAPVTVRASQDRHQRRGREEIPPPPREAAPSDGSQDAWLRLKAAWNAGPGRPWTPPEPADGAMERLAEPGWLEQAADAIGRLRGCQYFTTPVTLPQFCRAGFVQRVLGGQYDAAKAPKGGLPGEPPKVPPERRRFYRAEAGESMSDDEFSAWKRRVSAVAGGTT